MTAGNTIQPPPRRLRLLAWFSAITLVTVAAGATAIWINTTPSIDPAAGGSGGAATEVAAASVEAQGGPDAVVAAFDHGRITDLAVVGGSELGADTPLYIGSLSKTFTATVAARLIDDGRLALDTPVTDYLPSFRVHGEYEQITVRHLLNQTSGVPTGACMVDLTTPEASLQQRVDELSDVELVNEPGTTFHYCNKNFAVLALIIENVTGRPYSEVLAEEVIEPLGLEHTYVEPPSDRDVTAGHLPMFGAQLPASTPFYPGALADGYLISSASDLAIFADVLATGTHHDSPYLSAATLEQMHTAPDGVAEDPDYGSTYGFGLRMIDINGEQMLWHEGELATAHANMGILPQSRTGLIVLTTQNGQLYSGDAPFLTGMERLAGLTSSAVEDGGFRAVALIMAAVAGVTIAAIITDMLRWPRILQNTRRHRLARTAAPRLIVALVLCAAVFFGVGSMLGLSGAVPLPLLWTGAPDLTAIALAAIGYLTASAAALALLPRHAPATPAGD